MHCTVPYVHTYSLHVYTCMHRICTCAYGEAEQVHKRECTLTWIIETLKSDTLAHADYFDKDTHSLTHSLT